MANSERNCFEVFLQKIISHVVLLLQYSSHDDVLIPHLAGRSPVTAFAEVYFMIDLRRIRCPK